MRYIVVPSPAPLEHLTDTKTGKHPELSFADLVRKVLVSDPSVTTNDDSITKFLAVSDAVKDVAPGYVCALSDEDHEFLSTIARGFQYAPDVKLAILPLIKAITGAPTKRPEGLIKSDPRAATSNGLEGHEPAALAGASAE